MGGEIKKDANKQKLRNELDSLMEGFNETFAGRSDAKTASDLVGKKLDDIG